MYSPRLTIYKLSVLVTLVTLILYNRVFFHLDPLLVCIFSIGKDLGLAMLLYIKNDYDFID